MCGSMWGGMNGFIQGVHDFMWGACVVLWAGGMHGFIRGVCDRGGACMTEGGVHGFMRGGACMVLFGGHA